MILCNDAKMLWIGSFILSSKKGSFWRPTYQWSQKLLHMATFTVFCAISNFSNFSQTSLTFLLLFLLCSLHISFPEWSVSQTIRYLHDIVFQTNAMATLRFPAGVYHLPNMIYFQRQIPECKKAPHINQGSSQTVWRLVLNCPVAFLFVPCTCNMLTK